MVSIPLMAYHVCTVDEVHDGDTVKMHIDQGLGAHRHEWLRFKDVFAPELSESGGQKATTDLLAILERDGPIFQVITERLAKAVLLIRERQTFGRYVATVIGLGAGGLGPAGFAPVGGAGFPPTVNDQMRALGYTNQGTGAVKR
jgi:hypothetical protein